VRVINVVNLMKLLPTSEHPHGMSDGECVRNKRIEHKEYVRKYGDDMPEVRDWKWAG
jgi:phosphoketolase